MGVYFCHKFVPVLSECVCVAILCEFVCVAVLCECVCVFAEKFVLEK